MTKTFTKIANPSTLPASTGQGAGFSAKTDFLAVAHYTTPFVTIYTFSNDVLTKITNPSTLPTALAYDCAFSPNGNFLAVGHYSSPYLIMYRISGTSFTKLTTFSAYTTTTYGCAFSPNGKYFAASLGTSPYVSLYSINSSAFTDITSKLGTYPTGVGQSCNFSSDGKFLAVSHNISPFITIYYINSATGNIYKLQNPTDLPPGAGTYCSFSPDGKYLAVVSGTSPYLVIYSINNLTFTKITTIDTLPPGMAQGCSFSARSNFLAVASITSPYLTIYSINDGVFTKISDPATLPPQGNSCQFSPDGQYLAVAGGTPYVAVYKYNSMPVLSNLAANITSTHSESIVISFTATDADSDPLTYQISINGTVYQAYQTYTDTVTLTIPASSFVSGTNSILVSIDDGYAAIVTGELLITMINSTPTLTGTLDKQVLSAVIGDADNDTISWMATLNDAELYAWSDFSASPVSVDFTIPADQVNVNVENTLTISYKDSLGATGSVDFDFVGIDNSTTKPLLPFIL